MHLWPNDALRFVYVQALASKCARAANTQAFERAVRGISDFEVFTLAEIALSQKTNSEWVGIAFPIARINGGNDGENYPQYEDNGQNNKPNAHVAKGGGKEHINRVADLKI